VTLSTTVTLTDVLAVLGFALGVINLTLKLREMRSAGPRLRIRVIRGSITPAKRSELSTRILIANYGRAPTTIQHCELATTNSRLRALWRPWKAADSIIIPMMGQERQAAPGGSEIEFAMNEWLMAEKFSKFRHVFACLYVTTQAKPVTQRVPKWDWPPKGYEDPSPAFDATPD
jgi:hypothetical protein